VVSLWKIWDIYWTYSSCTLLHCGKLGSFFVAMPVKHHKLPLTSEIEYESWTCITPEGHRRLPLKTLFYDPCWFRHISAVKSGMTSLFLSSLFLSSVLHEHHSKTSYPLHGVLRHSTFDPYPRSTKVETCTGYAGNKAAAGFCTLCWWTFNQVKNPKDPTHVDC